MWNVCEIQYVKCVWDSICDMWDVFFRFNIWDVFFRFNMWEVCASVSSAGARVNSVQYFFVEFLDELVRLCPFIDFVFCMLCCYVWMFLYVIVMSSVRSVHVFWMQFPVSFVLSFLVFALLVFALLVFALFLYRYMFYWPWHIIVSTSRQGFWSLRFNWFGTP